MRGQKQAARNKMQKIIVEIDPEQVIHVMSQAMKGSSTPNAYWVAIAEMFPSDWKSMMRSFYTNSTEQAIEGVERIVNDELHKEMMKKKE